MRQISKVIFKLALTHFYRSIYLSAVCLIPSSSPPPPPTFLPSSSKKHFHFSLSLSAFYYTRMLCCCVYNKFTLWKEDECLRTTTTIADWGNERDSKQASKSCAALKWEGWKFKTSHNFRFCWSVERTFFSKFTLAVSVVCMQRKMWREKKIVQLKSSGHTFTSPK